MVELHLVLIKTCKLLCWCVHPFECVYMCSDSTRHIMYHYTYVCIYLYSVCVCIHLSVYIMCSDSTRCHTIHMYVYTCTISTVDKMCWLLKESFPSYLVSCIHTVEHMYNGQRTVPTSQISIPLYSRAVSQLETLCMYMNTCIIHYYYYGSTVMVVWWSHTMGRELSNKYIHLSIQELCDFTYMYDVIYV